MIFRGGEFSTGEMGNFHPPLTQRRRRWFGTCPCRPVPVGIEPRRVHLVIKTSHISSGPPAIPEGRISRFRFWPWHCLRETFPRRVTLKRSLAYAPTRSGLPLDWSLNYGSSDLRR
jgi:hypothetical protein